ncbi:MAG TPA: Ppx/GppA phosphatase family protein [Thermoanaerobaculia bacterium]|nr:Ppx/GppA phosphatase family protein [Thermoanaerobaculia bacterium]
MPQIGLVDLGSNNARLVVYEYQPGAWFRLVDDISEPIRLGEGLGTTGRLTTGAIARGLAALDLFSDYAAAARLDELLILGTSALRDAGNAELFTSAAQPLGFTIRVLSGEEEAQLGVLAVANGFAVEDAWVMDLGGGSAQISRMKKRRYARGEAYPLGAVRLTESFLASDPPRRSQVKELEERVGKFLAPVARALAKDDLPWIAMGGTIRNLAEAVQEATAYPLSLLHGYFLRREHLDGLIERMQAVKSAERSRIAGINPDRADVILAGALVYRWLLAASGREGLTVSGHGMREGAFYQRFLPAPHRLAEVRRFSIANLTARFGLATAHTAHVRRLARQLFDGLAPLHGLSAAEADLLDAAASLHDVGITVNYYRHHRHGSYILEAESLPGLSHREHALLIELVRLHHKGLPRLDRFRQLLRPGDKELLLRLTTCLRLAEALERSRAQRIERVEVQPGDRVIRLGLVSAEEPAVEAWEAAKHGPLVKLAFGRRLVIETA